MLLGVVESKVQIGDAAKLQTLENFVTDKAHSVFERLDGAFLLLFRPPSRDEDPGMATVGCQAHLVDHDGDFQARVLQLAGQHSVDFVGDLFADSLVTMVGCGHNLCRCTGKWLSTASRREAQAAAE